MSDEVEAIPRKPTLFRNYISFAGATLVVASLICIVLLILVEVTGSAENPYLGIVTYILLPGVLIFGLLVIVVGMIIERRRRRRSPDSDIATYPRLDLNIPRQRHIVFTLVGLAFAFVLMSAFGSYKAYEYSESVEFCGETCHSVMKPEAVAFAATSHAHIRCVDCHVGNGPQAYARAKLNGAHQLYSLAFNKYSRPIETPVKNMRPANETCEHCHWPSKFYGGELKTFNHYAYDEKNSLRQQRMMLNVGGGDKNTGPVAGIHWHMNIANEITYIPSDDRRQVISWIRVKDRQGNVTDYYDRTRPLTPAQIESGEKRRMDCIDCHNRPAHRYLPPDLAVDQSLAAGTLDPGLPYLKRETIASLSQAYSTENEAVQQIASRLDNFYRTSYSSVYSEKADAIKNAIAETQRIYRTYFFPEMKTSWETHPNNIGHLYSSGCFRCHDGDHVSDSGKVITNNCNVCHTMLSDSARQSSSPAPNLQIQHPVDLGGLADLKCQTCHKPNEPFKHPVNLGDISMFQCVECHPRKN